MHTEARTRVAADQIELVRSLVGSGTAPEGFDGSRIHATAEALLLKRAHSVARAWPGLARSLGSTFDERFTAYARSRPILQGGGPLSDGRGFAKALARVGALADDVTVEALAYDIKYRVIGERAVARRGVSIRTALLKQSQRLIIAIRFPLFGERWISLRLKFL